MKKDKYPQPFFLKSEHKDLDFSRLSDEELQGFSTQIEILIGYMVNRELVIETRMKKISFYSNSPNSKYPEKYTFSTDYEAMMALAILKKILWSRRYQEMVKSLPDPAGISAILYCKNFNELLEDAYGQIKEREELSKFENLRKIYLKKFYFNSIDNQIFDLKDVDEKLLVVNTFLKELKNADVELHLGAEYKNILDEAEKIRIDLETEKRIKPLLEKIDELKLQSQEFQEENEDTSIPLKMIIMDQLGIIDHLNKIPNINTSTLAMAGILGSLLNEKQTSVQSVLNPMRNPNASQEKNPYKSAKACKEAAYTLNKYNIPFNLPEENDLG